MVRLLVWMLILLSDGSLLQADTSAICGAKTLEPGSRIILQGKIVSKAPSDNEQNFYIAELDGVCGILVVPELPMIPQLTIGEVVTIEGAVGLFESEACVYASSISSEHTLRIPPLFAVNSSALGGGAFGLQPGISGGTGLNNTGLLVRTCGRVIDVGVGEFRIGVEDESEAVVVSLPDPVLGLPCQGEFVVVTGISSIRETGGERVREIRPRSASDISLALPDLRVEDVTQTGAVVRWRSDTQGPAVVKLDGVVAPFRDWLPASTRIQAITYAPSERLRWGQALTAEIIDSDLELIKLANANAVNLYDLAGTALTQPILPGSRMTVQEYIAEKCRSLGLKIIARLEWYPKQPYQEWTFAFDAHSPSHMPHRDAEAILSYYSGVISLFSQPRYAATLQCYLLNMPMDDGDVQREFAAGTPPGFPTASQQREYVGHIRSRMSELAPGSKVLVTAHYSVADGIPVAPLADLVDGIALTAYPTRCNTTPFITGLTPVRCDQPADPSLAPALGISPWFVTCGVNQVEFWLDKLMRTNGMNDLSKLMLDGVGFAPDVTHWAGLVRDERTKAQALRDFFSYFGASGLAGTMQFGLLDKLGEASWGIVVPEHEIPHNVPGTYHEVTVDNMTPGAVYRAWVKQGGYWSLPILFQTESPCQETPLTSITVTSPHYGNALVGEGDKYQITWTTRDISQSPIYLFADTDDRGLNGIFIGAGDTAAGVIEADLSVLPAGGHHIFAKVPVNPSCAAPGGEVWSYSLGRVIQPAVVGGERCLITVPMCSEPCEFVFDGIPDEQFWQGLSWTTYAVHPGINDSTVARVKMKCDIDFLYLAFDVDDDYVETNDAAPWDGDCVSVWLRKIAPPELSANFGYEARQDACMGDNSWRSRSRAKAGTICNDNTGLDSGFTVEMRVPWSDIGIVPVGGMVLECDLMSVDHDRNPHGGINYPTVFSKLFWDGDGTGDHLGGAILLGN